MTLSAEIWCLGCSKTSVTFDIIQISGKPARLAKNYNLRHQKLYLFLNYFDMKVRTCFADKLMFIVAKFQ